MYVLKPKKGSKRLLEEFDRLGCCLLDTMQPLQLCTYSRNNLQHVARNKGTEGGDERKDLKESMREEGKKMRKQKFSKKAGNVGRKNRKKRPKCRSGQKRTAEVSSRVKMEVGMSDLQISCNKFYSVQIYIKFLLLPQIPFFCFKRNIFQFHPQ